MSSSKNVFIRMLRLKYTVVISIFVKIGIVIASSLCSIGRILEIIATVNVSLKTIFSNAIAMLTK